MISIVCVYNNKNMLENVLLKSLENQSVQFELITLDNRNNRFKSAAEALNYGGRKAKGDYIVFAHQDMLFSDDLWLENAERVLGTILDLGVAGVAGASEKGSTWKERCRHSITVFDENWDVAPVENVEEVQTLDECVLIVPQSVFSKVKFDEKIFDGWDSYGPDYCLAAKRHGKKSYVIPGESSHCSLRAGSRPWEFKGLLKYQKRLYKKYKTDHQMIYTWMGKLTWWTLRYHDLLMLIGPLYLKLFPDNDILLANELSECDSVLDLGCGHKSPVFTLNIPFSVGVELSDLYLQESKRLDIHSEYIAADIREIEFKPKSFDAVIALNVMEQLTKQEGIDLIKKMEQWARKKVVVGASNMPLKNNAGGDSQALIWISKELDSLGFKVRGTGGWNKIKQEKTHLRVILSALTQKIVFYFPKHAIGIITSMKLGSD